MRLDPAAKVCSQRGAVEMTRRNFREKNVGGEMTGFVMTRYKEQSRKR